MTDHPRVTTLLKRLQKRCDKRKVTFDDVLDVFGRRASAPLLFALGILLVSPIGGIPGVAPVFGVVIVLIAGQALFRDGIWLPQWLRKRGTSAAKMRKALERVTPWVSKMERYMRPRLRWLAASPFSWLCDLLITGIGATVPFFGLIPGGLVLPGLAIALLSIARFHHDGVWTLAGLSAALGAYGLLVYASAENVF